MKTISITLPLPPPSFSSSPSSPSSLLHKIQVQRPYLPLDYRDAIHAHMETIPRRRTIKVSGTPDQQIRIFGHDDTGRKGDNDITPITGSGGLVVEMGGEINAAWPAFWHVWEVEREREGGRVIYERCF